MREPSSPSPLRGEGRGEGAGGTAGIPSLPAPPPPPALPPEGRGGGPDARLAVDIGGTFTDVVIEQGGRRTTTKLLTTPDAPERAVVEGMRQVLAAAQLTPDRLQLVIHGTTLATNALIERKGALTALIATQGFRDSVE